MAPLDQVRDVQVDEDGKYKYVLIKAHDLKDGSSKYIVRGYRFAQYHVDCYETAESEVATNKDVELECVGGGRIIKKMSSKTIEVFGYSQGYGKADHNITADILKKEFPDYTVTWNDEGY